MIVGLKTPIRGGTLQDLAIKVLRISRRGLTARARIDRNGKDEGVFLDVLDEIAQSGVTPAENSLAAFESEWGGDIDRIYQARSY